MSKIIYPFSETEGVHYLINHPEGYIQGEFYQDGEVLHRVRPFPDNDRIGYHLIAKFDEHGELHDYPLNQLSKRRPKERFRVIKDIDDASKR